MSASSLIPVRLESITGKVVLNIFHAVAIKIVNTGDKEFITSGEAVAVSAHGDREELDDTTITQHFTSSKLHSRIGPLRIVE